LANDWEKKKRSAAFLYSIKVAETVLYRGQPKRKKETSVTRPDQKTLSEDRT